MLDTVQTFVTLLTDASERVEAAFKIYMASLGTGMQSAAKAEWMNAQAALASSANLYLPVIQKALDNAKEAA